jgi:hypothetical protein
MNDSRRNTSVDASLLRLLELERKALARVEKLTRKVGKCVQQLRIRDGGRASSDRK